MSKYFKLYIYSNKWMTEVALDVQPIMPVGKITLSKCLGRGGYGKVHLGKDSRGVECAVKSISSDHKLRCVMEGVIMSSLKHPHINTRSEIKIDKKVIYIMQDVALSDLSTKKYTPVNLWSDIGMMVSAVEIMHRHEIIHCDIKPDNYLKYKDGNIKLSDFSLSIYCPKGSKGGKGKAGTQYYLSPEMFQGQRWNTATDLWSLGCTIYEIACGTNLFPYQGSCNVKGMSSEQKRTAKAEHNLKYLSAISDFASETGQVFNIKKVDHVRFKFCQKYYALQDNVKALILSLLKVDPSQRITASSLLQKCWPDKFKAIHMWMISTTRCPWESVKGDYKWYQSYVNKYCSKEAVRLVSLLICQTSLSIKICKEKRIDACINLACKILGISKDMIDEAKTIQTEMKICTETGFRFLPIHS